MPDQAIASPYLTKDMSGIGGKIKVQPQDFQVWEIPLYPCSGEGEHLFLEVEKTNMSTMQALERIAAVLKISPREIGYAGIKDAYAITRQTFSVPFRGEPNVQEISLPGIKILAVQRHANKLHIGHLQGNRFAILVREVQNVKNLLDILSVLQKRGVPNYFGEQRFGVQKNTHIVGKALLHQEKEKACDALFTPETSIESKEWKEVLDLYREGKYKEAQALTPSTFLTERNILRMLASGSTKAQAVSRLPYKMQKFYICAYQSALFNRTLALRMQSEGIDQVWVGDLAVKHPGRAVFRVLDSEVEQARCQKGEISPSGPLFGYKMLEPQGKQGEREKAILAEEGTTLEMFRAYHFKGERRSYRFCLQDVSYEKKEEGVLLQFSLNKGCYATMVLREIMKVGDQDLPPEETSDDEEE